MKNLEQIQKNNHEIIQNSKQIEKDNVLNKTNTVTKKLNSQKNARNKLFPTTKT